MRPSSARDNYPIRKMLVYQRFSAGTQAFLLPKTQQKPNSSGKTSASSVDYSISYIIYTLYIWSIWSIPYFTHDNARYRTVYNNMKSETLTIGVVKPWSILTKLWSTLPAYLRRLHGGVWPVSLPVLVVILPPHSRGLFRLLSESLTSFLDFSNCAFCALSISAVY